MKAAASFAAGFVSGWIVRSTVDSSREAVVKLVALGYEAAARARRLFALERERLDDLAAEARVRVENAEPIRVQPDGGGAEGQAERREQRA